MPGQTDPAVSSDRTGMTLIQFLYEIKIIKSSDKLVHIQGCLTPVAPHDPPKDGVAAMGTMVPGLFIRHPFFSPPLPAVRDTPENDFFAYRHGEMINMGAWKLAALMASGIASLLCAGSDGTLPAVHEKVFRLAAAAPDVINRQLFAVRERSFPGGVALIKMDQLFFKLLIAIPVCDMDGTDPAIKPARGNKIRV